MTLVSMGPAGSMQGIRQALAMGAAKAVVVDDSGLRGSDALLTARVLAAAIAREGFDLVIAGTESTDGYSGVVPQMVAELLDVPALTYATHVEVGDGKVTIHRQTTTGLRGGRGLASGRRLGHRRSRRAALSDLQRNHGRQEEAGRESDPRRPRCRTGRRSEGGRHLRRRLPGPPEPRSKTTARPTLKIVELLNQKKVI